MTARVTDQRRPVLPPRGGRRMLGAGIPKWPLTTSRTTISMPAAWAAWPRGNDADNVPPLTRKRGAVPKALQVAIFRRDQWLCRWCKRPVIFALVMKYVERELRRSGQYGTSAYYHAHCSGGQAAQAGFMRRHALSADARLQRGV